MIPVKVFLIIDYSAAGIFIAGTAKKIPP